MLPITSVLTSLSCEALKTRSELFNKSPSVKAARIVTFILLYNTCIDVRISMESFRKDMPLDTSFRVQYSYTCDTKKTLLAHVLALTDNTSHESLVTGYGQRRQHPDGHMLVPENFE